MVRKDRDDGARRHDVFLSYSQRDDSELAAVFQRCLENIQRPWYRPRELRVFRDTTNLPAGHDLWQVIERELERSDWLVVLASPAARDSWWVREEIKWWIARGRAQSLLIVHTRGRLAWDRERGCWDRATDALPIDLLPAAGAGRPSPPRWGDLTWLTQRLAEGEKVRHNDPRLLLDVAEVAAPVRGVSKVQLIGAHQRVRRLRNRTVGAAVSVLAVLLVVAVVLAVVAEQRRDVATERQLTATSRQLVAEAASIRDTQPDLARQLLVEAYRLAPTAQVVGALIDSPAVPRVIHTDRSPSGVAGSPDGRIVACAAGEAATLYDTATGRTVATLRGSGSRVTSVAFRADGELLAVGQADGRIELWRVRSAAAPERLGTVTPVAGHVDRLVFAGTRPLLVATGGGAQLSVVDFRDARHPRTQAVLTPFDLAGIDRGLAASPDGRTVAASSETGKVRLLRLTDAGGLDPLKTLASPSTALAFSPGGQLLAAGGGDDTTRLWDVADPGEPELRSVLNGQSLGIEAVAFTDEGTTLATGAGDGTIHLWDVSDPVRPTQGSRLTGHTSFIYGLDFTPDGRTLVSASADGANRSSDGSDDRNGSVRLWSVSGAVRTSSGTSLPLGRLSPQPFDPRGRLLAGGSPASVWRLDGAEPRRVATLPTFNQGGQYMSFSPDGRLLATGVPVRLWDMADPSAPREVQGSAALTDGSQPVLFGADGALAVGAGDADEGPGLWDVRRRPPVPVARLKASPDGPRVFAGDRDLLVTAREGERDVQLWDTSEPASPAAGATLRPGTDSRRVTSLATSPDGRVLLVGDSYGTITTWDIDDPRHPRRLGRAERHNGSVTALAVHADGDLAASADDKGSVRLWDLSEPADPRETAVLLETPLDRAPSGLAFSPDGNSLAVTAGPTTQLWDVRIEDVLGRLCRDSVAITRDQWSQYLPDRAYDPPCAPPGGPADAGRTP
ncbi:TIR domain-containing protein [Streptomyces sp. NPDC048182]|uniref:TIR domain-containing protein n=1 Tax=Streptomyces sp. NPDC048182 TaxID=3365507 RepID=UPI00371F8B0D